MLSGMALVFVGLDAFLFGAEEPELFALAQIFGWAGLFMSLGVVV